MIFHGANCVIWTEFDSKFVCTAGFGTFGMFSIRIVCALQNKAEGITILTKTIYSYVQYVWDKFCKILLMCCLLIKCRMICCKTINSIVAYLHLILPMKYKKPLCKHGYKSTWTRYPTTNDYLDSQESWLCVSDLL